MKIQFLGATGTVTGSKYLVQTSSAKILVDCGLFQGYKQLRLRNWASLPVSPSDIDAVVLTHAHLDHSGYLPLLVRDGFRGKIYCTDATRDLCKIMLADTGRLQEEEAAFANRHGYSKHKPAMPLYTEKDAEKCMQHFHALPFGAKHSVAEGVQVSFVHAGHILGAASLTIEADGKSLVFSGDLGRTTDLVMMPPEAIEQADYLVLESTYGDRLHEPDDPGERLASVISETVARGGVVIIPAFAVGRAQTLLYYIAVLKQRGAIPDWLPVYLDSPMAIDVTDLYKKYPKSHKLTPAQCAAMCGAAKMINKVDDSKALSSQRVPMVIVAASGMATGGRVLHHIANFAGDTRNTILFTGFQAGGTRGAAMLGGADSVKIHGEYIPLRASIDHIDNLSAHADYGETLEWLAHFKKAPERIFITHGEPKAADALRHHIQERFGWNCEVPDYLETANLGGPV